MIHTAQARARRQENAGILVMDFAQGLRRVMEAGNGTEAERKEARAQLDEAKDALAGREEALDLLHQWTIGTAGGKSVLAGGNLVPAVEYFLHQVQDELVPGHMCAVCVMVQDGRTDG